MKKTIFLMLAFSFLLIACNSNSDKTKETKVKETKTEEAAPVAEQLYACPMHQDITGKKGDKCSKCGMALSEPVKKAETPK